MADARDYKKQHRNTYGEAPHAARKAIPRGKQRQHQALRRKASALIKERGVDAEPSVADRLARVRGFKKAPDLPLGYVVMLDLCRRLVRGQLSVSAFRSKMLRLRANYPDFTVQFQRVYYLFSFFPGAVPADEAVRQALAEFA